MRSVRFSRELLITARGYLAYGLSPLVGVVTAPILARALGPEGRGEMAALLQPLTIADALAAFGLPVAVTYFTARGASPRSLAKATRRVAAITCIPVIAILMFYAVEISERTDIPYALVASLWLSPLLAVAIAYRRARWQGLNKTGVLDLERATGAVLRVISVVALFLLGVASGYVFAVGYIFSGLVGAWVLYRLTPRAPMESLTVSSGRLLTFVMPVGFGTVAVAANNRLDQAFLPSLISLQELGVYAVAVTLAELPAVIGVVTHRNLLAESSGGHHRAKLMRTASIGIVASGAICLTLFAAAPPLVRLAFGAEFSSAARCVQILVLGTFVSTLTLCTIAVAAGRGRPALSSVPSLAGLVVTVVLLVLMRNNMTALLASKISVASSVSSLAAAGIVLYRLRPKHSGATPTS